MLGMAGVVIESLGHDLRLVRALQAVHDEKHVPDWPDELDIVYGNFEAISTD
jgi:hypothetical protein